MRRSRLVRAAFDRGQIPTIACFNQAKTPLGLDLDKLLAALQRFVDTCVAPVWGTPAKLVRSTGFLKGAWAIVFLDTADSPGALAYHDLTPDGFPLSKVFVKTILDDQSSVSVATSHELVEMLVDPAINIWSMGPESGVFYAYETADPVEAEADAFKVDGIAMTDFVYPSYFEDFRKPRSTQFDYTKKVSRPFQILKGGYQIIFKKGKETRDLRLEGQGEELRRRGPSRASLRVPTPSRPALSLVAVPGQGRQAVLRSPTRNPKLETTYRGWLGGSSHIWWLICQLPSDWLRSSVRNVPALRELFASAPWPVVHATREWPRSQATSPEPPTSSTTCESSVTVVGGPPFGNQNARAALLPTRGSTPWCGIRTAFSVKSRRTPSSSLASQAFS